MGVERGNWETDPTWYNWSLALIFWITCLWGLLWACCPSMGYMYEFFQRSCRSHYCPQLWYGRLLPSSQRLFPQIPHPSATDDQWASFLSIFPALFPSTKKSLVFAILKIQSSKNLYQQKSLPIEGQKPQVVLNCEEVQALKEETLPCLSVCCC